MKPLYLLMATALVTATLAACGGDGDAPTPPVMTDVPGSAAQSSDSYVAYTVALVQAAADETAEALGLGAIDAPPTSETAEPVDID